VVTLFNLTSRHFEKWRQVKGSEAVPTYGFTYHVGLEPVKVSVERMLGIFKAGTTELGSVWGSVLDPGDCEQLKAMAELPVEEYRFPLDLWTRIIYDYAVAYHDKTINVDHLIKSLTPLYLGKTASFIIEVEDRDHHGAEAEIERLCAEFENNKDYLMSKWREGE